MKRRDFIEQTAKSFGYTIGAASMAQLLSACSNEKTQDATQTSSTVSNTPTNTITNTPKNTGMFNDIEKQTLTVMADAVIPKTDTPSASEVGAIAFMITFVEHVFNAQQQASFLTGLKTARENILAQNKKDFIELSQDEQTNYVNRLDAMTFNNTLTDSPAQNFYKQFKRLTVLGYYQSELVGETLLNYDPIPGGFIGCMPYDGKVMSLN